MHHGTSVLPYKNSQLMQRDLAVLWHPCTQMKDHETLPLVHIRRGEGVWLEDFDGKRYLAAISSWWVNLFGHANPRINAALRDQLDQLEHVLLAGFSHAPAIELAERLTQLVPPGLTRCFYADNGSSAVEVALKMSFHYWRNLGAMNKTKFITLSNSYHGETLGALAVGDVALYKETYRPLLMQAITVPSPDCYARDPGSSWAEHSTRMFEHMRAALERHADECCAVIVEPLVQCAGSMRMYDPAYLTLLRTACDEYGVHLIADEIAVGFGRTGTLFACEQAGITPDFMCLSKGLTGGYLPLAAVLTREEIYRAFYDEYHHLAAAPFADHPHVTEVRQCGMIVAIEMVQDKTTRAPYPWQERRGLRVYQYGLEHGVLLRPLGNVVYFMPPYVITPQEIQRMAEVAWHGIQCATS